MSENENTISRRTGLKLLAGGTLAGFGLGSARGQEDSRGAEDPWAQAHDRVFLGGHVWANPMEDWRLRDGAAECLHAGTMRSVHSLTHQLTSNRPFAMSVTIERVQDGNNDGGAGFRIGLRSDIGDHRANCFVTRGGVTAGLRDGSLILGPQAAKLPADKIAFPIALSLTGTPDGSNCTLSLTAHNSEGVELASLTRKVPGNRILGNVSLAHNLSQDDKTRNDTRYRFRNWQLAGEGFTVTPENRFGPILWTMYTLHDTRSAEGFVLKLSALTGPMSDKDSREVELMIENNGQWKSLGSAPLDPDASLATFRIANWDASTVVPFKTVYHEKHRDGSTIAHDWTGTIRANPAGPLRMGALTCQNDIGFPYAPVAENLSRLDPDLLFFSGDQLYEQHGGFGIVFNPFEKGLLNYLRKFYQFGWAFGEPMRHSPTLCLPDDHDVFHGNIWGEGGAPYNREVPGSNAGGYRMKARMVNAVHRTNCGHHPDPVAPKPCQQDISVYYGDMLYGGVSFAIIADRQWKSGPEKSGNPFNKEINRIDHVVDPDYDTTKLDKPGLQLLGERQENFLAEWSNNWDGHTMKVVLSQTVFAGAATHHGGPDNYLKADLDCGGWPQTARDRAIELLRPSMALHVNGDQHLSSLVQYGVEQQRDSNWSFCTPAISVGYPRWWRADEMDFPHQNRPKHGLPDTGEYLDGLGNKMYLYAVGNPLLEPGKVSKNRYEMAHNKGSGFGLVTIDSEAKTYTLDCFRFLIDASDGKAGNQFPGWPVVIHQEENKGVNRIS